MKIAIIGQGYVGKAIKELVENHYEIVTYDPKLNLDYPKEDIDKCELACYCLCPYSYERGRHVQYVYSRARYK